ncbi:uncharacterized protein LOC130725799 [Lotus japonicus]|uniref:uncharacterized protein LOC130725799 n=1 Tax=Lotus japonicus TaxID=34305 RepID=UPI00258BCBFB|nr:uncharacterized protein LOC130725799 [Lotus japonicus]
MERWVRWILLRPGFISLKTYGSSLWDWGVVRSTEGNWIFGFTWHACVCDSLRTKLLAILRGLSLCWEHGHRRVEFFIDSLLALGLITAYHPLLHQYACIIGSIKSLLRRSWVVHCRHKLREGNVVADHLAKLGSTHASVVSVWSAPLDGLCPFCKLMYLVWLF